MNWQSSFLLQATDCHIAYSPSLEWWFPAVGILFLLVASVFVIKMRGWRRVFALAIGGFALLWTIGAGLQMLGFYSSARRAANASSTPAIEGTVDHFQTPAPQSTGGGYESFTVRGVPFSYSYYIISGAFRQTAAHGGPIHQGLYVRIHYRPDSDAYIVHPIVRLEICP